jgi:thymidylate synthase (FAD)
MELVKSSIQIITPIDAAAIKRRIEAAGRTCYCSFDKTTECSAEPFIKSLIDRGHTSVLEHESISVRIITDRGVLAEITRHRHNSFSVASTRYINYAKKGIAFVIPPWTSFKPMELSGEQVFTHKDTYSANEPDYAWLTAIWVAQQSYNDLIKLGWKPEQARSVLPNSLRTEIVTTANLRQWRTVLQQRTARAAHIQMREVANMIYDGFISQGLGIFFEDIIPCREGLEAK